MSEQHEAGHEVERAALEPHAPQPTVSGGAILGAAAGMGNAAFSNMVSRTALPPGEMDESRPFDRAAAPASPVAAAPASPIGAALARTVELRRAAAPTPFSGAVISRQPLGLPTQQPPQQDPLGLRPPPQQDPFGPSPQQPAPTGPAPIPSPAVAGTTAAGGIIEDVPTTPVTSFVGATPPPLSAEMPKAVIPDPGLIPGWRQQLPPKVYEFGPMKYTEPGGEVLIVGVNHSGNTREAWEEYRRFCLDVEDNWNSGARTTLNTIAQEGQGNKELEGMVGELKKAFNIDIKRGKGDLTKQSAAQQVGGGSSVAEVQQRVSDAQKDQALTEGMQKTTGATPGTTADSPARKAMKDLNIKRGATKSAAQAVANKALDVDGLQTELAGAKAAVDAAELKAQNDATEEQKKEIESGMATLKKVSPEIARLAGLVNSMVTDIKKVTDPLTKLATDVTKVAETGDAMAALDALKTVASLARMSEINKLNDTIAANVQTIKAKEAASIQSKYEGVGKQVKAAMDELIRLRGDAERALEAEKLAYDELAKEIEKSGAWQGKGGEEGKRQSELVAKAVRAQPGVKKLIRLFYAAKTGLPKKPDPGTRAEQGHTLALKGEPAPGAAMLHEVLGWIEGAPMELEDHLTSWKAVETEIDKFIANLGVE